MWFHCRGKRQLMVKYVYALLECIDIETGRMTFERVSDIDYA